MIAAPIIQAETFDQAYEALSKEFVKVKNDAGRDALIPRWKELIQKYAADPKVAEAYYYLYRMIENNLDLRKTFLKETLPTYIGPVNHYHYMIMRAEYGQLVATDDEKIQIWRDILKKSENGIILPSPRWGVKNMAKARETVFRDVVWPEMEERTRRASDPQERFRVLNNLCAEYRAMKNGDEIFAVAYEWRRMEAAARGIKDPIPILPPISTPPKQAEPKEVSQETSYEYPTLELDVPPPLNGENTADNKKNTSFFERHTVLFQGAAFGLLGLGLVLLLIFLKTRRTLKTGEQK
jgi:hypothetical protein